MSTWNTGRSGNSHEMPGRASLADEVLSLVFFATWALLPGLLLAGAGAAAWGWLGRVPGAIASVLAFCLWVATARWQWCWLRGVFLRRALPNKLRQIGLVNGLGETPAVRRVSWGRDRITIRFASGAGHTMQNFTSRRAELAAVLGALTVEVASFSRTVEVIAVRHSAHESVQEQRW